MVSTVLIILSWLLLLLLGASSASFSISIIADDEPELNESFNVKLLSVAQVGQNIASTNVSL